MTAKQIRKLKHTPSALCRKAVSRTKDSSVISLREPTSVTHKIKGVNKDMKTVLFFIMAILGVGLVASAIVLLFTGHAAEALTAAFAGFIPSSLAFHLAD